MEMAGRALRERERATRDRNPSRHWGRGCSSATLAMAMQRPVRCPGVLENNRAAQTSARHWSGIHGCTLFL